MGIFGDYTIQQLKDSTVEVIRTKFKAKLDLMTKKQLIILYLKGNDMDIENMEIQDREEGEDCPNGQVWRLRVIRDMLGNKLRSTRLDWSYYPTGTVDIVTTTEMDASDVVTSVKKLKHYGGCKTTRMD